MSRIRQGGGFGFVILLVVMAVLLLLASRNWQAVTPAAIAITHSSKDSKTAPLSSDIPPPAVNSGAGQRQIQSSLSDTQKKTAAHAKQLDGALED